MGQANLTSSVTIHLDEVPHVTDDVSVLSKDEMERLQTLIGSLSKPSGTCSLAMNGKNYVHSCPLMLLILFLLNHGLLTLVLLII